MTKRRKPTPVRRRRPKLTARPRTFEEVKAANLADPFHAARIARLDSGERFDDPNGPSDDRWAREVFVHPDCEGGSHWMVDWGDRDGGCYVTTFDGPMAEQRAREYFDALKAGRLTNVTKHIATVRAGGRLLETRILKLWRNQKSIEFPVVLSGADGDRSAAVLAAWYVI